MEYSLNYVDPISRISCVPYSDSLLACAPLHYTRDMNGHTCNLRMYNCIVCKAHPQFTFSSRGSQFGFARSGDPLSADLPGRIDLAIRCLQTSRVASMPRKRVANSWSPLQKADKPCVVVLPLMPQSHSAKLWLPFEIRQRYDTKSEKVGLLSSMIWNVLSLSERSRIRS